MVLGNAQEIRAHAQAMKEMASQDATHPHSAGTAITVPPGQTREWVVTFPQATELQMACLIPGHYEAGMHGKLSVLPSDARVDTPLERAPSAKGEHPHGAHAH